MAEVNSIDFNKIPRQRFSQSDVKKVASIIENVKSGNIEEAKDQFDTFSRDKKMDKVRSVVLTAASVISILSIAIAKHKPCPEGIKSFGNIIATRGADFARKHKKVYDKMAKKFPELVQNVGEDFATRALDSADAMKKILGKAIKNGQETEKFVGKLADRGIKNFGDVVGIGLAALTSIPTSILASKIGNVLDEYGDGDRKLGKEEPKEAPKAQESFEEESSSTDGGIKLRM